jgi:hypothetical protein
MNRSEATAVLRELLDACNGLILTSCVFLAPVGSENYNLHIKCALDETLRRCALAVCEKHKLKMKETGGTVIIYRE